jgi:hypothetical protein
MSRKRKSPKVWRITLLVKDSPAVGEVYLTKKELKRDPLDVGGLPGVKVKVQEIEEVING